MVERTGHTHIFLTVCFLAKTICANRQALWFHLDPKSGTKQNECIILIFLILIEGSGSDFWKIRKKLVR